MAEHGGNDKYGTLAGVVFYSMYPDMDNIFIDGYPDYIFSFSAVNELGQAVKYQFKPGVGIHIGNDGPGDYNIVYEWVLPTPMVDIEISSLQLLTPLPYQLLDRYEFGYYNYVDKHAGKPPGEDHPGTMVTGTFKATIPAGSYSYQNIAKYITDIMDTRILLKNSESIQTGNDFLRRSDEDGDIKFLIVSDGKEDPEGNLPNAIIPSTASNDQMFYFSNPFWFGSTQNSLQYNLDNERDIFSFEYLHTPMKDSQGATITLDILDPVTDNWNTVNKNGGVFLISAEPESFWQDKLGFDLNTILVKPETVALADNVQIIRDTMLKDGVTITGNFLNLDGLTVLPSGQNLYTNEIVINTPNPIQSNSTYSINANNIESKISSGAYLVEVSGIPQTYMYGEDINTNISAVVSKQYNSSSLIVGFSDSSINYQHSGHAFTLQSLKIRILDIKTKKPAQDLGENSSIIFNLFKNPEPDNENKKLKKKN